MKIMLVCGAGVSTSILMRKMQNYSDENNLKATIKAYGVDEADDHYEDFDCVLVGPQISYRIKGIIENAKIPVEAINSVDYGLGNAENVMKQAMKLMEV